MQDPQRSIFSIEPPADNALRQIYHPTHLVQAFSQNHVCVAMELFTIVNYSFPGIRFILELATFLIVFIGFPTAPIVFMWIIDKILETAVDIPLPHVIAVRVCVALHTPLLLLVLWGAIPYYSVRDELHPNIRGVIFCLFCLFSEALTIFSIWTACVVGDWSFTLYLGSYFELATYCRALVAFFGAFWSLGWAIFLILTGCALEFGMPEEIRRMILEMRMLLAVTKILPFPDKDTGEVHCNS